MDFTTAVRATIRKHRMIPAGSRVLAAVSGGMDSMALLHSLARLRRPLDFKLAVAHVDHRIRSCSLRDLDFVRARASELGLPFYSDTLDVKKVSTSRGTGLEETARELRYRALGDIAAGEGFDRIATGHTASDQAETVLMRLISGTGIRGLAGIMPFRGDGVIRPLINTTRGEVEAFIEKEGIPFVTDETNADTSFTRNGIRHVLLPLIEGRFNPRAAHALAGAAEGAREMSEFVEAAALRRLKSLLIESAGGGVSIGRERFRKTAPALMGPVIEAALDMVETGSRLDRDHIEKLIELAERDGGAKSVNLPGGVRAKFSYDAVTFSKVKTISGHIQPEADSVEIPGPGTYTIHWAGVRMKFGGKTSTGKHAIVLDRDEADYPFVVRTFRPGDRIAPPFSRHTKKLKKIFIDRKVPRDKRGTIPILCCGEKIAWVPGLTNPPLPENPHLALHVAVITD